MRWEAGSAGWVEPPHSPESSLFTPKPPVDRCSVADTMLDLSSARWCGSNIDFKGYLLPWDALNDHVRLHADELAG